MPYYPFDPKSRLRKTWRVISPDGKIDEIVDNLPAFCRDNQLSPQLLRAVARGGYYLGWKCELIEGDTEK